MINSAEKEILLLLPTINAFLRQERLGIIELLKRVAIQNNVNIKILTPVNDFICKIIQSIENTNGKLTNYFNLRSYEEMTTTTVTIIIVDKKASLACRSINLWNRWERYTWRWSISYPTEYDTHREAIPNVYQLMLFVKLLDLDQPDYSSTCNNSGTP